MSSSSNQALQAILLEIESKQLALESLVATALKQLDSANLKTLSPSIAEAWCVIILKERKCVKRAADFVKEFEKVGYTIDPKVLSKLLTRSDRFKYHKNFGWKLLW